MTRTRQLLLLTAGAAMIVAANTRWGIGALAWVAPVPLLRYLRVTAGWRSRVLLAATIIAGWAGAVAKIATEPMPLVMAIVFGAIIGTFMAAGYLVADVVARGSLDPRVRVLVFPAAMVAAEWLQSVLTPLGTWGSAAYTQVGDTALLQLASVTGLWGISFLIYWAAAALEQMKASRTATSLRQLAVPAAVVALTHLAGAWRLDRVSTAGVRVAAVVSDATVGPGALPPRAEMLRVEDSLFARTERAARAGARLVSWTEVATAVSPAEEPALLARSSAAARRLGIDLVVAYAVPRPTRFAPARFENTYRWFHADGTLAQAYEKHHPVPGEPAIPGREPAEPVEMLQGRAGGALCYDFDFPPMARALSRLGVGIVVVPSADWRGIDPVHSEMATLRAIEGGFSVLRTTRGGLSAAIDPAGRMVARLSSFESKERVLLASLPTAPVGAPYRIVGDVVAWASVAFSLAMVIMVLAGLARRPAMGTPRPVRRLIPVGMLVLFMTDPCRLIAQEPMSRAAWSAEVDVLPFASGGYSAAAGYHRGAWRTSVNLFAARLPSFATRSGWSARILVGSALRVQRYPNAAARGFFYGAQVGFERLEYQRDGIAGASRITQLTLTPTAGWRWFPGRSGLYLMPAVGAGVGVWSSGVAVIGGQHLQAPRLAPIAGLHIGWEL